MKQFFVLLVLGIAVGLGGCVTTPSSKEAAMQKRIDMLEYELTKQIAETQTKARARPVVKMSEDPLFDTYEMLKEIEQTAGENVSALSYARGNYPEQVSVYPVGGKTKDIKSVLQPRNQQYPRHVMQLGQDVYTSDYSENVIVFPVKDPYIPTEEELAAMKADVLKGASENEYPAPVAPVVQSGPRRLTGY